MIALVLHGCDRYRLLYQGAVRLLRRHLPLEFFSCCYLLSEQASLHYPPFHLIQTGRGPWADRLRRGLKEIPEDWVVYVQEDFWFERGASLASWQALAAWAAKERPSLVKLHNCNQYQGRPVGEQFGGLPLARLDEATSGYLLSHQISLWRKDVLWEQLKPREHPWRNERRGSQRLKKRRDLWPLYQVDFFQVNALPAHHANAQQQQVGAYWTISDRSKLNQYAEKFIAQFLEQDPQDPYARRLKVHWEQGLTHDGDDGHDGRGGKKESKTLLASLMHGPKDK